ncbi:hypothetical protein GUITHDRAFT_156622 [Guillardia theta CCMP2712]|uniref:Uncharacterized protein n=1 Tax=Guillardia theta (strain CCMP2712) TaxID=905079 RepID=L1I679_GUITC|nr:hypothetical protein GUITHDRAFT_156622 [Guillardia theta CCMP2712]EKX31355.1 hypothetical protein GUITHDRAFT_156622 [Guillardia theta CCMP2712]|eukprot:XP_005818335.1 hypothetical protein GUITHDRAFT_156622 [Guillardia theta CCMP2712]
MTLSDAYPAGEDPDLSSCVDKLEHGKLKDCEHANRSKPYSGSPQSWHVMLANLIVCLRQYLSNQERDTFDRVHAAAHRREVPTVQFFSFTLELLRRQAPHLEDEFREIFRLRNASRRRAQQKCSGGLRSVKSEPALDTLPTQGRRSVPPNSRSCEDVNEAIWRFQGLSFDQEGSQTLLCKRQGEDVSQDDLVRRKTGMIVDQEHVMRSI